MHLVVFTTVGDRETAEKLSGLLIRKQLAASVQVSGPIASTYWWQNKITKSEEWVCQIKTTKELFPKVEAEIKENHDYELPEIYAIEIAQASEQYLSWISQYCTKGK